MNITAQLSMQVITYCERHDLSFWAEPVNALTNLAFLVSTWYSWVLYRRHLKGGPHGERVGVLIVLMASIGLGSFAFHTLATIWAVILDLVPIALFVFAYLRILLFFVFSMERKWVAGVSLMFVGVSFFCSIYPPMDIANGSSGYIAALVLFSSIVIAVYQKRMPHADDMLLGCLLFWVSLFLRTMDNAWCAQFPMGTHFMWHLLNAVVLIFLMRFLIFNLAAQKQAA